MKSQEAGFWAGGPVFATNFTGAKTVPVARGGGKKRPASAERLTGGAKLFFLFDVFENCYQIGSGYYEAIV